MPTCKQRSSISYPSDPFPSLSPNVPLFLPVMPVAMLFRHLKKLEIVQLVAVLHNVLLDLAADRPSNEVLHTPRHQESRITDLFDTHTDMALLNHLGRCLHGLGHTKSGHDDGQSPPGKGRDCDLVLHLRQLRLGLLSDVNNCSSRSPIPEDIPKEFPCRKACRAKAPRAFASPRCLGEAD